MFKKFCWDSLKEIQENKIRFAAVFICFVFAIILFFSDDGGEEIVLTENPAPVETAENVDASAKIITVQNSAASTANKNIKVVLGANSDVLFVHNPFRVSPKEKIESPPEIPPVITPPPVTQIPTSAEKFILRGVAIIENNKSVLVQKFSDDKNSEENLILEIGDTLKGKKIFDISTDSLILEDGEILYLETQ